MKIMDMPEDLEPKGIPIKEWLYNQEYWSLNCTGDPSNCLGCRNWGGEGICLFDEDEEVEGEKHDDSNNSY